MNLPVFYDEEYLQNNPESYSITSLGNRAARSWLHMACPSKENYIDLWMRQFSDLIKRIRLDYVSYDFIRFYVFWEEVEPGKPPDTIEHGCFCPECQRRYRKFSGEKLRVINGIVERSPRKSPGDWKTSVITETARRLNSAVADASGGTPVYVKTIPWKAADFDLGMGWISGQDIESLGRISDGILPMAFTQIFGQTPAWKKDL
jgi:hypothetical protein